MGRFKLAGLIFLLVNLHPSMYYTEKTLIMKLVFGQSK